MLRPCSTTVNVVPSGQGGYTLQGPGTSIIGYGVSPTAALAEAITAIMNGLEKHYGNVSTATECLSDALYRAGFPATMLVGPARD